MRRHAIDHPQTTLQRAGLIRRKPFLARLYRSWYEEIAAWIPRQGGGAVLELGSGAGFFKQVVPAALTSDILQLPIVDAVLDARRLPFKDGALKAVVMVDVFHHLPDAAMFLAEAERCLTPGGRLVMIEPWMTAFSRGVYRWLHPEPCRPSAASWRLPEGGPLSQANSALPWIVFFRDARRRRAAPLLGLTRLRLHTPLRYLLSGGMSVPFSLPASCFGPAGRLEALLGPWMPSLALFATIVVTRRGA